MSGKLDDISRVIGAIETSVRDLRLRADEDRETRDRWFAESRAAIAALTQKIDQHAAAAFQGRSLRHGPRLASPASWFLVGFWKLALNGR